MAAPKYLPTFRAASEYERQAAEARRREALAQALESQAYQPLSGSAAPTPSAAPLVMALQSYLTARQRRKGQEAEEKTRQADIEGAERLRQELKPEQRIMAPANEQIAASVGMPQVSETGEVTYSPTQQAPLRTDMVGPTAAERRSLFAQYGELGTPSAQRLAKVLASMEPEERQEKFGTTPIKGKGGKYYLASESGRLVETGVEVPEEGMTPYQREMVELRRREIASRAGPGGQRPLSATAQKELFETDENILATETGIDLIKQARQLSEKSFEGLGAGERAKAATLLPDKYEPSGAKETIEFDLLLKQQVLPQLRAIFGAAPTEGERAILLELQGSSSLPIRTRNAVLDRALTAAQRRLQFNRQKSEQLRSGTYFREQPAELSGALPPGAELDQ